MVIELGAQLVDLQSHQAQIHHHTVVRLGLAADSDFGVIGVAVDSQTSLGFDFSAQRMGGIEKEFLANAKSRRKW
jgi:hypothetical protein